MRRSTNQQLALKPQDLVILLKIATAGPGFTYAAMGKSLRMAASEVHGSLKRVQQARLITLSDQEVSLIKPAVREFVLFGAKYAFPPVMGTLMRGMPTAHAGPTLSRELIATEDPVPVWPYSKGSTRGVALHPLYPSVPEAAEQDGALYDLLTLFDAIRVGAAREREIATREFARRLS